MEDNTKKYQVSEITGKSVMAFVAAKNEALAELGSLEAEYLARKEKLLENVQQASSSLNSILKSAAKEVDVPLSEGKWNLDFKTMTFEKVS